MKKLLLTLPALLAAGAAFPQQGMQKPKPVGVTNMAEKLASKYRAINNPHEPATGQKQNQPAQQEAVVTSSGPEQGMSAVAVATWQAIGGSMNVYGVTSSQSRPLNYMSNLNAITFVHRKGGSYVAAPADNSGAEVARITTNWGASWDSTCIWSNATNLARYPQGGIYNPTGNTTISNAYIVGMGPVTDGTSWKGSWYASKQLGAGNYNNTASPAAGAQQFIPNTPPYNPGLAKHDFPRSSFSSTDDGNVRTIAARYYGYDVGIGGPVDYRGAAIVKGTFNAGVFTWTSDTIIPNAITRSAGTKQLWDEAVMAWNDAGTHGYVVFIGAAATATGSNKGWQPIIYKTTNSGNTWVSVPGIDFNDPSMNAIKAPILSVNGTSTEVPFFKIDEGYGVTVDVNNKLHIISTIVGTASNHNDSLEYTYQLGTDKYSWAHQPGQRPYLYDFIGDGSGQWSYVLVDSLTTEGPGSAATAPGYSLNPWDPDPSNQNEKVTSDNRCQIGRTPDGRFIVYSWADSDTAFVNGQKRWNVIPNIKARAMAITPGTMTMSPTRINVTKPATGANNNIANRAMFHYQSPTVLAVNCTGSTLQLKVPFTVTNSNPYSQLAENKHWFSGADLDFVLVGLTVCTGFNQNLAYNVGNIDIFPNPAKDNATVAIDLKEDADIKVEIYNMVGQLMQTKSMAGRTGENKFTMPVNNLSTGLYLVNIKTGNTVSTKKLVID